MIRHVIIAIHVSPDESLCDPRCAWLRYISGTAPHCVLFSLDDNHKHPRPLAPTSTSTRPFRCTPCLGAAALKGGNGQQQSP